MILAINIPEKLVNMVALATIQIVHRSVKLVRAAQILVQEDQEVMPAIYAMADMELWLKLAKQNAAALVLSVMNAETVQVKD